MVPNKFCVIGLGHFGFHLATRLNESGAEVLAIDSRDDIVELISERVTQAICMDSTDKRALENLGLSDMDTVIVAIGEDFESSIMTTAILQEIGVKQIYNRIISPIHEKLLKLMNIRHMLVPEAEAANQLVKRLILPGLIESFEISREFSIFEIAAPDEFVGKSLLELNLRKEFSLNLVTIKRENIKKQFLETGDTENYFAVGVPSPDTKIMKGDILVLFGTENDIIRIIGD